MKHLLISAAAIAVLGAATPAVAKNGRGHGAAHHQRIDRGFAFDRFVGRNGFCPPGLAKKNNGCLPPGHARRLGIGDRLPAYLAGYNVPLRYRDRFFDGRDHLYRYENDYLYRVDRRTGLIDEIIWALGL